MAGFKRLTDEVHKPSKHGAEDVKHQTVEGHLHFLHDHGHKDDDEVHNGKLATLAMGPTYLELTSLLVAKLEGQHLACILKCRWMHR